MQFVNNSHLPENFLVAVASNVGPRTPKERTVFRFSRTDNEISFADASCEEMRSTNGT